MKKDRGPIVPALSVVFEPVILKAEPEPVQIDLKRTAILVIDVQNAFASEGGFFDLFYKNISHCQKVFNPIRSITNAARARDIKIIYVAHRYSPDFHEAGGPESPNWYKNPDFFLVREHPEWRDKFCIRGTWGAEIANEVKPQNGDIVVEKHRFSAFPGTNLNMTLETYNIKYLVFTGLATNICVESTLRDAYFHEYFPILVSDAVAASGPQFTQLATEFAVKEVFGWLTTSDDVLDAIK